MIRILGIGKVKDQFCREKINDYLQRLTKYSKVEYLEAQHLPKDISSELILLDERGKEFTSKEFSQYIKKRTLENKNTTFILGPAEGFPEEFLKKIPEKISVSKMTLPHELARVIFIEQLYRAFSILNNEPYHK